MTQLGFKTNNQYITTQNPVPTTTDRVYASDVDTTYSDMNGFSGVVTDLFDDLHTVSVDSSATNPKTIKVWFKGTQQLYSVGFGCDDGTKDFSNIKITVFGSNETVRDIVDNTADSTKYNSLTIDFAPVKANGLIVEFHTADEVAISNLVIFKTNNVNARIQAVQDDGDVVDISATDKGNLKIAVNEYGDTPSIDAFARLRISEPFTLFDSKQLHDKQPLFWSETTGGSATSVHSSANASTLMSVTANANDYVIRQTFQRLNYQPGKSQLAYLTFQGGNTSGVTRRVGLFDGTGTNNLTPNNGIFFETNGTISWNIAKNGTITETIPQSSWNIDPLDGTGDSGITLNIDTPQIIIIDYEWLGVGRVRVGFIIDGLIHYVHYFNHANNPAFSSVYMSTPNLPLRYSIQSNGTGSGSMQHICSSVISEGGIQQTGILRALDNHTTAITATTVGVNYALLGIRLKSTYNDISINPISTSLLSTSNDNFHWELVFNPSVAGTFTYNDLTDSAVQGAIGTTANTSTGGTVISSGFGSTGIATTIPLITALRIGTSIGGTADTIVLRVSPLTTNATILGALTWREFL